MWNVQAAEEPSHWIFQLAHGDVLGTPEEKTASSEHPKPTILASNKTMHSSQIKHKEPAKEDPWLHNDPYDPWRSPAPTRELSVGQVSSIRTNVLNAVMEKIKPSMTEDDAVSGNQEGRIAALEQKFGQLSTTKARAKPCIPTSASTDPGIRPQD